MNIARPLGTAEIEKSLEVEISGNIHELARGSTAVFRQGEASDAETSTDNLAGLLRRVAEASTREVDSLIGDLQALRRKLNTEAERQCRQPKEGSTYPSGFLVNAPLLENGNNMLHGLGVRAIFAGDYQIGLAIDWFAFRQQSIDPFPLIAAAQQGSVIPS